MVRQTSSRLYPPVDFDPVDLDDQVIQFPARQASFAPAEVAARSTSRPATVQQGRVRTRAIRQVAVVDVAGRLGEVVEDLDLAVQLALADGPRGVVCDLSGVIPGADRDAVEALATIGRHARDWSGIPVAVACSDPRVCEALEADPVGGHLVVTTSLFSAVSAVLAVPAVAVESLSLAPHPTAPRASREFVTRSLLDWRLGRVIPFATLVVSELVASSSINTGTQIEVSVAWSLGALRLSVRDHGPGLPGHPPTLSLQGRRRAVVAGLSRAFGVMPADDGGKVVWAVLEAPRPLPSIRRMRSGRAREDSPVFTDGQGLAELPFCAGSTGPSASASSSPSQGADRILAP
jgi:hypothetical protein